MNLLALPDEILDHLLWRNMPYSYALTWTCRRLRNLGWLGNSRRHRLRMARIRFSWDSRSSQMLDMPYFYADYVRYMPPHPTEPLACFDDFGGIMVIGASARQLSILLPVYHAMHSRCVCVRLGKITLLQLVSRVGLPTFLQWAWATLNAMSSCELLTFAQQIAAILGGHDRADSVYRALVEIGMRRQEVEMRRALLPAYKRPYAEDVE